MSEVWKPLAILLAEDDTAHLQRLPREVCASCGHVAQYRDDVRHDATGVWHGPSCGGYYTPEDVTQ